MKLDFIEVCGFRGFRDKLQVTFGSGFHRHHRSQRCGQEHAVRRGRVRPDRIDRQVHGRKGGAGELERLPVVEGSGKGGRPTTVTASFKGDAGEVFTITRSRESGADKTAAEIEAALCRNVRPDDALRQLCRTSIIRDEWIAALSLDLSETERFEHVRGALGLGQGSDFGTKAKAVLKAAEMAHASRQAAYAEARNQLTRALTGLAEAKEAIARTGDASAAMQTLVCRNTRRTGGTDCTLGRWARSPYRRPRSTWAPLGRRYVRGARSSHFGAPSKPPKQSRSGLRRSSVWPP